MNTDTCLTTGHCLECDAPLLHAEAQGLCPRCLLKVGLASQFGENSVTNAGTRKVVPPPLFPFEFGGYRMLRLLGRGGMGAVYEAEEMESGRRVALKVLGHSLDSADTRKRFLREGRLAASINHPNSVYVYGTEEIDGTPVITMELVPGGTLYERVRAGGAMAVGEAIDAILQVVAGLEAAHQAGILHRDVKPSNCFIEPGGAVKVGDFGLSISTLSRGDSALTVTGSILGTPEFASPEQLRGEALDVRSDIYSVGATLYFLLTGKAPFRGENLVQLLATVLDKTAPSPRALRPEIPESLARIILRCLAKPAGDRFRDYDEFRRALLPFGSTAPTPATLGLRFVAGWIDHIVLTTINMLVPFLIAGDLVGIGDPALYRTEKWLWISSAMILLEVAYFGVPEGLWGASPGKSLTGLRVGGLDRNAPGIPRAMLRALIYLAPTFVASFRFRSGAVATEMNAWMILAGIALSLYPALLFVTARRRNGFATCIDLLTKTRVIQKSAYQPREMVAQTGEPEVMAETLAKIGPYHVLGPFGDLVLGYDTKLMRRVWIRQVAAGTPPAMAEGRNATRPGNLRWLQGRRDEAGGWDAFEALPGSPLTALVKSPQPWKQVRHWLLDLASELEAAARDGSMPEALSLDRVWITADGRAKLLDFPAPGALPVAEVETDIFLNQVALSALEGRVASPEDARSRVQRMPVALRARDFLRTLRENADFAALASQLKALVQQVPHVSRRRRLGLIAGCLVPALVCTAFSYTAMKMFSQWQSKYPDIAPLRDALTMRFAIPHGALPSGVDPSTATECTEVYIGGRFGNLIRDPKVWNSQYATSAILPMMRRDAERIAAAHPAPSEAEMAHARSVLGAMLAGHGIEGDSKGAPPGGLFPMGMVWLSFGGILFWAAFFSAAAAVLFRGGLLLRMLGIAVVTRDGEDASRLRMLWRACLSWSWLPASAALLSLMIPVAGLIAGIAVTATLVGAFVAWSAACRCSLQDRLAGTRLVPR